MEFNKSEYYAENLSTEFHEKVYDLYSEYSEEVDEESFLIFSLINIAIVHYFGMVDGVYPNIDEEEEKRSTFLEIVSDFYDEQAKDLPRFTHD